MSRWGGEGQKFEGIWWKRKAERQAKTFSRLPRVRREIRPFSCALLSLPAEKARICPLSTVGL